MHIKIMNTGHGKVYANKGSSGRLVNYLEKENKDKERGRETFFDGQRNVVTGKEVKEGIDGNTKRLGKNETKFYTMSVSPSKDDMKHLGKTKEEQRKNFRKYIREEVMPAYAKNFAPDKKGNKIREQDLRWYGKIEYNRYYHGDDKEVIKGKARSGERKPGPQMHAHIIVSRNSAYGKEKLQEMGRDRERKLSPNGARKFFSKEQFAEKCIDRFNRNYTHEKELNRVREARLLREGKSITPEQEKEKQIKQTPGQSLSM